MVSQKEPKTFEKVLTFTLEWEGGYVNDPDDLGAETNIGISHATYDSYRRSKGLSVRSVRYLEASELKDIYRNMYWVRSKCDLLPPLIAMVVFDWAVNAGVGRAIKTLQSVVGSTPDGIWGANTQKAVEAYIKLHGDRALALAYNRNRRAKYLAWAVGSQAKFKQGWLRRVDSLSDIIKA